MAVATLGRATECTPDDYAKGLEDRPAARGDGAWTAAQDDYVTLLLNRLHGRELPYEFDLTEDECAEHFPSGPARVKYAWNIVHELSRLVVRRAFREHCLHIDLSSGSRRIACRFLRADELAPLPASAAAAAAIAKNR